MTDILHVRGRPKVHVVSKSQQKRFATQRGDICTRCCAPMIDTPVCPVCGFVTEGDARKIVMGLLNWPVDESGREVDDPCS